METYYIKSKRALTLRTDTSPEWKGQHSEWTVVNTLI